MPRVPVNLSSSIAANTSHAGLLLGTPVTSARAANSLFISNTVDGGDVAIVANRSGNSEDYLWADASAGKLTLTSPADHMDIKTVADGKVIKLNSRNYVATTGDYIGVQIKPAATVTKTADGLKGLEVSPRVNSGVALAGASGTVIGIHSDVYLKGTAAGTIAGDVRALNLELVTDDAGTRTVSGEVNAIRIRAAFSATITGAFCPIRIEKAETQTGSAQWEYVLDLTGNNDLIWDSDYSTEPADENGGFKVRINGADRWVKTYSTAPIE